MTKLESFLFSQIKDENDEKYIKYIAKFRSLADSSHLAIERKGAILGYFSIVNVIKKICTEKEVEICHTKLLDELMKSIVFSLKDNDNKIILSAAQCMYNIMVYFNPYVLMNFNDFFDGLLTIVTIDDPEIKDMADNFDSSLKGVINYSFQGTLPENFNLLEFFKKIILNINLENPANKCTIVSWINCINQIPGIKLINILYLFLGELFDMLKIKNEKVQNITNDCLKDFYNEIENDFEDISYKIKIKIFEIVKEKCEKNKPEEEQIKLKAFQWASLFLQQYKFLFIRLANNQKIVVKKLTNNNINIENLDDNPNNINNDEKIEEKEKEKAKEKMNEKINEKSEEESFESGFWADDDDNKKFPFDLFTKFLKIVFNNLKDRKESKINFIIINNYNSKSENSNNKDNKNDNVENLDTIIDNCNNLLVAIFEKYNMNTNNKNQLEEVFMKYLFYENKDLLLSVINWIDIFFNKFREDAYSKNFNKFIQNFSFIINYKDELIFKNGIKTLCNIEKCRKGSINSIILHILNKLKEKENIFAVKRAKEFVRVLCTELEVKHVYSTFADVLSQMDKSNFVRKIINILNMFLLTSNDTEDLRNLLKNNQKTTNLQEKYFFEKLFSIWCINPVSCLILCLIAEDFELTYNLLGKFGKIQLNQENYFEYAQLVQVLESKEFISKTISI